MSQRHIGNLTVTTANAHSFPAAAEFFGHLTIVAGVVLTAPKLTMIRGWLTLEGTTVGGMGQGAKLIAPGLGLVDGWVTLGLGASLSAIHLTEIRNDLTLAGDNEDADLQTTFPGEALTQAGAVNLQRNADYGFPSLTEVRDGVTLAAGASLGCPALTRIGKSLTLREKAWLGAPGLIRVGGYLDMDETAQLVGPNIASWGVPGR